MSKRQFHTKSRHGCLQCKKNRTKCDENKPACGRCVRIGSECSLADEMSGLIIIPAKSPETQKEQGVSSSSKRNSNNDLGTSTTSISSTDHPAAEPSFTNMDRERLRLMTHYNVYTAKSIDDITIHMSVNRDEDESIWNSWIPELAFEHDFLLYALLSLSALHLALRGIAPEKHTVMALQYHGPGVTLFQQEISHITVKNFDAVFAFSCIIALYTFGIQRSSEIEANPIAKIHQVMMILRGSSVIVRCNYETLMKQSRWSAFLLDIPVKHTSSLPDEIKDTLSALRKRVLTSATSTAQEDMYNSAIDALRDNITLAMRYPRTQMEIVLFPIMSSIEFWELLGFGEPLTLAVLANYAVILYWMRENVWIEGWGKETVDAVHQTLSTDWYDCIAWAVRETNYPGQHHRS